MALFFAHHLYARLERFPNHFFAFLPECLGVFRVERITAHTFTDRRYSHIIWNYIAHVAVLAIASADLVNAGRAVELKQSFYKELTDRLHQGVKLRKEDVFINLVEVPKENWSYGNGVAQYVAR
jgi:phenylpyruvate tautomerase PptA (4-oxalocrotonate tautomerase family)